MTSSFAPPHREESAACCVRLSVLHDIDGIVALSQRVYPESPYARLEIASQLASFPEGQFIGEDPSGSVIGMTSCLVVDSRRYDLLADWNTFTGRGTLKNHHPRGDVLYGVETMVDAEWRRSGIAKR